MPNPDRRVSSRYPLVMIAPEGTTKHGNVLLRFSTGAFVPGRPVLPVCTVAGCSRTVSLFSQTMPDAAFPTHVPCFLHVEEICEAEILQRHLHTLHAHVQHPATTSILGR